MTSKTSFNKSARDRTKPLIAVEVELSGVLLVPSKKNRPSKLPVTTTGKPILIYDALYKYLNYCF